VRAFPLQIIEVGEDVILKRGRVEVRVSGEQSAPTVRRTFELLAGPGLRRSELLDAFPEPTRAGVASLVEYLLERRFLTVASGHHEDGCEEETARDVYYWHFGRNGRQVSGALARKRIVLVGLNVISRHLARRLVGESGVALTLVDVPRLRNDSEPSGDGLDPRAWPPGQLTSLKREAGELDAEEYDCVVATCDFGGQAVLRDWNRYCVRRKIHFLPVLVWDLIGYVGPLVVPGETACFECHRLRQDSHMADPSVERLSESVHSESALAFHPAISAILGEFAALELLRFYGIGWPWWRAGTLVELNTMSMSLVNRRVLKLPHCPVCSPRRLQPPTL
jgi:bacteriocin biosynthesis cyclodehydratase domain-containing protein